MSSTLASFHNAAKSLTYFSISVIVVFVILSNSLTAVFKSIWSDVGDHWAAVWNYVFNHFSPFGAYFFGTLVIPASFYWILGLAFIYFDLKSYPSIISRYKVQPFKNEPLNWELFSKCAKVVLFNQIVVSGILVVLGYPVVCWRGLSTSLPLPSFNRFLWEMFSFLLIEEVLFYYSHRLLHHPIFYGRIHKLHHQFTAPISIAAIYCHPLEHVFSNLLPIFAGPFLMGSHLAVMIVWFLLAVINTLNVHSGYHLPFLPSPQAHDFHHLRFNENFGVLGILDFIHGTDKTFRKSRQFQQHRVFFSFDEYPDGHKYVSEKTDDKKLKSE